MIGVSGPLALSVSIEIDGHLRIRSRIADSVHRPTRVAVNGAIGDHWDAATGTRPL
jgi:hypothetical protein